MCDHSSAAHDEPVVDSSRDPVLSRAPGLSRRNLLRVGGVAAGAVATRGLWVPGSAWGASKTSLSGLSPIRNAMHVHGSWSEGTASWESQYAQAAAIGTDVLWLTDHDFRALAYKYIDSLTGVPMVATESGSLSQSTATIDSKGLTRVVAESASASAPASVSYAVPVKPTAFDKMRVSIAGQQLTVAFPSARIDSGGTYDVVLQLSNHPAYGSRPAGQFALHYRFGDLGNARYVDSSRIVGVMTAPTPAAGSQITIDPTADVTALWPDMLAIDNSLFMLTLVATSPAKGTVVDVSVTIDFARSQNDAADVTNNQQTIIDTYGPRYPNLNAYPTSEISFLLPHIIPFGVTPMWPDQAPIVANETAGYGSVVDSVHAQGGLVSYNHPFGDTQNALFPAAQQTALRRSTFATMMADNLMGCDILEVGYTTRGSCTTQTFLDLWDTFSRHAVFITGNGVNDDHSGLHWSSLTNGFATGIWATSPSQENLVAALAAGRAYSYHAGHWPNGQLDLLVGDQIPMGNVEQSSRTSRLLEIGAANLPSGSVVDVVQGPVDYTGNDPGTTVIDSIPAAKFGSSGMASLRIQTPNSSFVRTQVRNAAGAIIGISNPVWTLKAQPPAGIPASRATS